MSNLNSYNILINRFKAFADGHFLLKNFTYGAITLADLQKFGLYPFMHIVPVDVSYETGVKNFSFDIFFADLPREEDNKAEYQKETLSDLQQIAEDLLGEITNHRVLFGRDVTVLSSRLVPFEEEFSNVLTGWNLSITLQIPYNWSACEIPATFNDYVVYNQNTGESSILEFKDSIVREGGEVRLVNDVEFPDASYYYGTDQNGERGWFAFPTDEVGLTCETLGACSTIIDIQTNITNLENDVEDISANVVQLQTDLTTLEESLSAVATSGDYNDLINTPTIPTSLPTSQVSHEVKLGSTMTKGTPVYVSSADGTNMIVSPASNTSEATSSKTLGLLMEGGNTNAKVQVITEGLLDGLDTSTATIGDAVWLGSSGTLVYGLANKPVAPLHMVFIGIVTRVNANNGEIFVKVQNGFEIDELHNVATAQSKTTPVDADAVLLYDSADANGLWKKLSWSNIKATLKTYFDSLYQATLVSGTNIKTINGNSVLGSGDLTISGGGLNTDIVSVNWYHELYYSVFGGVWKNIAPQNKSRILHQSFECDFHTATSSQLAPFTLLNGGGSTTLLASSLSMGRLMFGSGISANSGMALWLNATPTNTPVPILPNQQMDFLFNMRTNFNAQHMVRVGFGTSNNSLNINDIATGYYIEINAGVLRGKTALNSVRSQTTTSYSLNQNTFHARIKLSNDGNTAEFYLYSSSGTLLWSNTLQTNVPTYSSTNCFVSAYAINAGAIEIVVCDFISFYTPLQQLERGALS